MKIRKLCIITDQYPTKEDPIYSFLDEVICKFADKGIQCVVICPKSILDKAHKAKTRTRLTALGNRISIYCPKYIPFSGLEFGRIKLWKLSMKSIFITAYRIYKRYAYDCDVLYAHFYKNGIIASKIGQRENKPVFVASGESSFDTGLKFYEAFHHDISQISGVIAVSSDVKNRIYKYNMLPKDENIVVLPNGVNLENFRQLDKGECRAQLKIPSNLFIVAFVGHFIERKGITRVIEAINSCSDVYALFIGDDKLPKDCSKALFVGKVPHDKLRIYLSAADAFILPSTDEGCCNAIIEAQVLGMPIIASKMPFNEDILSEDSAVLVNPYSLEEIRQALVSLRDNKQLLNKLKDASQKNAPERNIDERISRIIEFISGECDRSKAEKG